MLVTIKTWSWNVKKMLYTLDYVEDHVFGILYESNLETCFFVKTTNYEEELKLALEKMKRRDPYAEINEAA